MYLGPDGPLSKDTDLTVISDQQKGLIKVVGEILPEAKSSAKGEFGKAMSTIKTLFKNAHKWLMNMILLFGVEPSSVLQQNAQILRTIYVSAESPGKYLDLPMTIGRSKISTFTFLQDRVNQKLQMWRNQRKVCDRIEKKMNAYWWGNGGTGTGIRWMSWSRMCMVKEQVPKISDFGLAKLVEEKTHMSTRVAGTYGYMAPEYAMRGTLTDKADVYNFGIVALEIVSGMSNTSSRSEQETLYLLEWAHELKAKGNLRDLVDERLGSEFIEKEAMLIINLALLCTNVSPVVRPAMSSVVGILEGRSLMQDYFSDRSTNSEIKQPTNFLDIQQQSYVTSSSGDSQLKDESMTYSWTASPPSRSDLYLINVESNSGK
ncbi:hypothetical protein AgCh_037878 [Apium graveolens]